MQVDLIKPTLKAPGSKRSKLKCNILPSTYAVNFDLRHFNKDSTRARHVLNRIVTLKVGRCRLTLSNPS